MLYGLYASTFFYNVLFYMALLRAIPAGDLFIYNGAYMLLCSLGMILYGFYHEKLSATRQSQVLFVLLPLSAVSSLCPYSTTGGHLFVFLGLLLFPAAFGYLAAHIAWLAACTIPVKRQGFFTGAALALANLCLYFALLLPDSSQALPLLLAIGFTGWLLWRWGTTASVSPPATCDCYRDNICRHLPLAVLIAATLGVLVGLDDSIFIPHFAEYQQHFFGMSRLFTACGFLLAGFLADMSPFYLPLLALAAKSVPLFVRAGSPEFILSLLAYTDAFCTGALIVLVIRLFFFLAPYTRRPRLWAAMGRGIEMPASGLAAAFGTIYLENSSLSLILACHTAVLLGCALLFYQALLLYARRPKAPLTIAPRFTPFAHAVNNLSSPELLLAGDTAMALGSSASNLDALQKEYGLTSRERDVLGEVLQEKSIADIAATLFITERTVKYHIGNLLKKTACKNQKELREKIQHTSSLFDR